MKRLAAGLGLAVISVAAGCVEDAATDANDDDTREAGVVSDTVVGSNAPLEKLALATNGARGGGERAGSLDVYSLDYTDENSSLTLTWSGSRVTNGPGVDFVVFENPFLFGTRGNTFMDPIVVELSDGGEEWVAFPHDYLAEDETAYSALREDWAGFAGVNPVLYHEEDNAVSPFDADTAGGDAFDLDDLPDAGEAGAIRTGGFTHIRLVAAATVTNPDTGQVFPRDPASDGPDIDGVYARYVEPNDVE